MGAKAPIIDTSMENSVDDPRAVGDLPVSEDDNATHNVLNDSLAAGEQAELVDDDTAMGDSDEVPVQDTASTDEFR
ncbi:MAG: hypothetical protein Q9225_002622 [Loekoesia sp. 1 TL-2023]